MPNAIIPLGNWLIRERESRGLLDRSFSRPQLLFFGPLGNVTFTFPYAPREVSYSQLAAQHNEIRRPGAYPIIDRVNPQLMQVSMEFRVADRKSKGASSVESKLNDLRRIALFPGSVLVSGMDTYLSRPIAPTVVWQNANWAWFKITDLNIDVVQRDLFNQATQADVRMTLTEERNPYIPAVVLPRIVYEDEPVRRSTAGAQRNQGGGGSSGSQGGGSSGRPITDAL